MPSHRCVLPFHRHRPQTLTPMAAAPQGPYSLWSEITDAPKHHITSCLCSAMFTLAASRSTVQTAATGL